MVMGYAFPALFDFLIIRHLTSMYVNIVIDSEIYRKYHIIKANIMYIHIYIILIISLINFHTKLKLDIATVTKMLLYCSIQCIRIFTFH